MISRTRNQLPRLRTILKWIGLAVLAWLAWLFPGDWIYRNTPLGCYIEEEYPPLKSGTPEYAAMQVAARQGPQDIVNPPSGLGVRTHLYTEEYPIKGRDRIYSVKRDAREFWFINFHPRHPKTFFGCDYGHFDGTWTAIVRKSDLALMNIKGEEFN